MNEMKLVAEKCNVDWEMAVEGFIRDGRIGHSHLDVPGHDGKRDLEEVVSRKIFKW